MSQKTNCGNAASHCHVPNESVSKKVVITKLELAKQFGVDKKTFKKWVCFLCEEPLAKKYVNARKLDAETAEEIANQLGVPGESGQVLSKKEIVKVCEGTLRTLRACILGEPEAFGLTTDAFKKLNVFPPKIAQKIILVYR